MPEQDFICSNGVVVHAANEQDIRAALHRGVHRVELGERYRTTELSEACDVLTTLIR